MTTSNTEVRDCEDICNLPTEKLHDRETMIRRDILSHVTRRQATVDGVAFELERPRINEFLSTTIYSPLPRNGRVIPPSLAAQWVGPDIRRRFRSAPGGPMCRLMLVLTVAVAVLGTPAPATGQSGTRALTLEDYYALKTVGAPRISPDGRWVAYTVSTRVETDNGTAVETFLAATDGSPEPQPVLRDGQAMTNPRWSEDGHLHVDDSSGDRWSFDPERVSAPATRVDVPDVTGVVSPDGTSRAVLRPFTQPAEVEREMTDFERRHQERFEGVQFDWYPFVRDGRDFPLPDRSLQPTTEIFLEAVDGSGEPRQLTRLGLRPGSVSWHPDGRTILFTADESIHDELAYPRTDLFTVDVDGRVTRLTDDGFVYSSVGYSPDGRWISYVRSYGTDYIIERKLDHGGGRDLYVRPVDGGEPTNLTGDWDLDAGRPRWSPDSRHMYFTTGIGGATHLFRVAPTGEGVEQITTGYRRIRGLSIDGSFRRMSYLVGEFERPSEVWTADIDGSTERRISDVHDPFLAAVASSRSERVLYESYDGTPIEGFVLYPYAYDPSAGSYPLIVVNHGGPHSASGYGFSFKNQLFAANG